MVFEDGGCVAVGSGSCCCCCFVSVCSSFDSVVWCCSSSGSCFFSSSSSANAAFKDDCESWWVLGGSRRMVVDDKDGTKESSFSWTFVFVVGGDSGSSISAVTLFGSLSLSSCCGASGMGNDGCGSCCSCRSSSCCGCCGCCWVGTGGSKCKVKGGVACRNQAKMSPKSQSRTVCHSFVFWLLLSLPVQALAQCNNRDCAGTTRTLLFLLLSSCSDRVSSTTCAPVACSSHQGVKTNRVCKAEKLSNWTVCRSVRFFSVPWWSFCFLSLGGWVVLVVVLVVVVLVGRTVSGSGGGSGCWCEGPCSASSSSLVVVEIVLVDILVVLVVLVLVMLVLEQHGPCLSSVGCFFVWFAVRFVHDGPTGVSESAEFCMGEGRASGFARFAYRTWVARTMDSVLYRRIASTTHDCAGAHSLVLSFLFRIERADKTQEGRMPRPSHRPGPPPPPSSSFLSSRSLRKEDEDPSHRPPHEQHGFWHWVWHATCHDCCYWGPPPHLRRLPPHLRPDRVSWHLYLTVVLTKLLLEVCGAAGAVWGFAEVINWRDSPTGHAARVVRGCSVATAVVFAVRWYWHVKHFWQHGYDFPYVKRHHRRSHWMHGTQVRFVVFGSSQQTP